MGDDKKQDSNLSERILKELWGSFAEESAELLEVIEQDLLKLEQNAEDAATIASLFRSMHTFKGSTGVMGLAKLEHLTHGAEDLMMLARDEGLLLTSEHMDALFKTLDILNQAMLEIVQTQQDFDSPELYSVAETLRHYVDTATIAEDKVAREDKDEASLEQEESLDPLADEAQVKAYFDKVWENLAVLRKNINALTEQYETELVQETQKYLKSLQCDSSQIGLLKISSFIERLLVYLNDKDGNFSILAERFNLLSSWLWEIDDRISFGDALGDFLEPYMETEGITEDMEEKLASDALETIVPETVISETTVKDEEKTTTIIEDKPIDVAVTKMPVEFDEIPANYKAKNSNSHHAIEQAIGQLISANSNLRQIKEQISETDLFELIDQLLKRNQQNWRLAKQSVREMVLDYEDNVREMFQVQDQMEVTIDTLQSSFSEANEVSFNCIVENIRQWCIHFGHQLDKKVVLKCEQNDQSLAIHSASVLEHNLQHLIMLMTYSQMYYPHPENNGGDIVVLLETRCEGQSLMILIHQDYDCTLNAINQELGDHRDWEPDPNQWLKKNQTILASDHFPGVNLYNIQQQMIGVGGQFSLLREAKGLQYQLSVHQGHAVLESMVVKVGEVAYVIPVHAVERIISPMESDLVQVAAEDHKQVLKLDKGVLPIESIHGQQQSLMDLSNKIVVVLHQGDCYKAIAVDQLLGIQQVMIHPLRGQIENIRGVSGCAILGKDEIGMVLDVAAI